MALKRAKSGDFALVSRLVEICKSATHPMLARVSSDVLGDAGTSTCFQNITKQMKNEENVGIVLNFCEALYYQGKLSNILLLLSSYEKYASNSDFDIVPVWISDLLESDEEQQLPEPDSLELDEYREAVLKRYTELLQKFGTDDILVFKGEMFGVISMAHFILGRIRMPYVRTSLRRKFEASTGVNCTEFYRNGVIQPLTAASIIEEFLASPESAKYAEGVRYFFGHRIPG